MSTCLSVSIAASAVGASATTRKRGSVSIIRVNTARDIAFEVREHAYREQRLTVKNKKYVSPDEDQLERIGRERQRGAGEVATTATEHVIEYRKQLEDEVRNLAQVEVGDLVLAQLHEEVSIDVYANPEGLEPVRQGGLPGGGEPGDAQRDARDPRRRP